MNKRLKHNMEEMQRIAEKRGGKCLSNTYINSKTKLLWQCAEGHKWEAKPSHIRSGHWCPDCAGVRKGTIEEMQQIARERNGKCISKNYINNKTHLLWICSEGHRWRARPTKIKMGRWCPKCGVKKRTEALKLDIRQFQQLAVKRGGKCLSDTYVNNKTKLLWECEVGHRWWATPSDIKSGSWCRYCAGNPILTIGDMQKIASERGGKCLSDTYVNSQTKLLWECAKGHQWEAIPNSIQRGTWCPECSSGLGERICREFFEQIFEKKFPKSYPEWLISQKGYQMQIDGYCKSLGIAFEHHGEQHYSEIKFYTGKERELIKRQDKDAFKRKICEQHGIILIEVPEIPTRLPIEKVRAFIKGECERKGIVLPPDFDKREIDLKKAYGTFASKEALKELQAIAKKRGGKCLSDNYVNSTTRLLWECKKKHQWQATPSMIKSGTWCRICAGNVKLTIDEMQKIAQARDGKCLSDTYVNFHTKLLWECAKGHQWEAKPSKIKSGQWCPVCARNVKLSIKEMKEIAQERGGKCLSDTYVNSQTKLLWECAEGHQWEAIPNSIKRGQCCPVCYKSKKQGKAQDL